MEKYYTDGKQSLTKDELREVYQEYDTKLDEMAERIQEYLKKDKGLKISYKKAVVLADEILDRYGEDIELREYLRIDGLDVAVIDKDRINEEYEKEGVKLDNLIKEIEDYFKKQGRDDINYSRAFRIADGLLAETGGNYDKALKIVKDGKIEDYVWI